MAVPDSAEWVERVARESRRNAQWYEQWGSRIGLPIIGEDDGVDADMDARAAQRQWSKISPLSLPPPSAASNRGLKSSRSQGSRGSRGGSFRALPAISSHADRKRELLKERQDQIREQLATLETLLNGTGATSMASRAPKALRAPSRPVSRPVTGRSEAPAAVDYYDAEGELPGGAQSAPVLPPIWEGHSAQAKPKSTPFPGPRHGVHFSWKIPTHTVSTWAQDGKPYGFPLPLGTNVGGIQFPQRTITAGLTSLPTLADHPVLRMQGGYR